MVTQSDQGQAHPWSGWHGYRWVKATAARCSHSSSAYGTATHMTLNYIMAGVVGCPGLAIYTPMAKLISASTLSQPQYAVLDTHLHNLILTASLPCLATIQHTWNNLIFITLQSMQPIINHTMVMVQVRWWENLCQPILKGKWPYSCINL